MKLKVQVSFEIEIEVDETFGDPPDGWGREDYIRWRIEDNGCPGTGPVGAAILKHIEESEEKSVCWACNLKGTNKIISGFNI